MLHREQLRGHGTHAMSEQYDGQAGIVFLCDPRQGDQVGDDCCKSVWAEIAQLLRVRRRRPVSPMIERVHVDSCFDERRRSEERRVGKEWRSRASQLQLKTNMNR